MVPYGKKTHPNNRALMISRMISLDKKFDKQPDLHTKYVETMNRYIEDRHTTKIDINQRNDNSNKKVNCIPHYAVIDINKPGIILVSFDFVGVLLQFQQSKFCAMTDIEKIPHQVLLEKKRQRYFK